MTLDTASYTAKCGKERHGGGLRKPSSSSCTVKGTFATTSGPSHSATVVPTAHDAALALEVQLDHEEELQVQNEEERAQKQKTAVAHVVENLFPYTPVVENLFPYTPVVVQTQKYSSDSPKAGQAYLWIVVDEDAIKRCGGATNSPVHYPVGVVVDADGNVFVSEVASGKAHPRDRPEQDGVCRARPAVENGVWREITT